MVRPPESTLMSSRDAPHLAFSEAHTINNVDGRRRAVTPLPVRYERNPEKTIQRPGRAFRCSLTSLWVRVLSAWARSYGVEPWSPLFLQCYVSRYGGDGDLASLSPLHSECPCCLVSLFAYGVSPLWMSIDVYDCLAIIAGKGLPCSVVVCLR